MGIHSRPHSHAAVRDPATWRRSVSPKDTRRHDAVLRAGLGTGHAVRGVTPKDVHTLLPEACGCVASRRVRNLAGDMELNTCSWRGGGVLNSPGAQRPHKPS